MCSRATFFFFGVIDLNIKLVTILSVCALFIKVDKSKKFKFIKEKKQRQFVRIFEDHDVLDSAILLFIFFVTLVFQTRLS